ncbi:uncharacterized protein [Rutidosis leptorrhynchoides]|uniref:uncharacterized protein n=1 Tax=Rutidosis leptorrhynchoides TaxID=125765 RepID=UPI003A998D08
MGWTRDFGKTHGLGIQGLKTSLRGYIGWSVTKLFRIASEFVLLAAQLDGAIIDLHRSDGWKWSWGNNGVYSVNNLVELIDGTTLASHSDSMETLRNRLVPKKIEVFIWRERRGRILVRLELDKRGIDLHSTRCPVCDDDLESVEHILFSCKFAKDIWDKVLNWWGYSLANFIYSDIFDGTFGALASDNKRLIWQALCWCVTYSLWKSRNSKVFKNKTDSAAVLFSEIQVISFEWIS